MVPEEIHKRTPRLAIKAWQYSNQIIHHAIQEGLREDGRELSLKGALPDCKKGHYAAVTKPGDLPALLKAIEGINSIHSRVVLLYKSLQNLVTRMIACFPCTDIVRFL
ncbi:MAG: hypothetical protein LZF85_03830 [Nitrosomonas sp.]|uniref:hypothetical protein n=1 Tax=Nitrosomonas sp. TaxID=42353 RepID=UPI0025CF4D83|nr:hypothetical protein [Nitrosomonas sp.]UJP03592.1 MAG: hypothetical protein LZF85_03830 [Nitrosomonas sp.]